MIAIVNYGSGNIQAICNIFNRLGIAHVVAAAPEQLRMADKVILPGVGAFDQAIGEDSVRFPQADRLPHMGWNTATPVRPNALFDKVDLDQGFYFLHSYYFSCDDRQDELMQTGYGRTYASAVNRRNIYGVQFHPEKSHQAGIQVLKNFALHV